jgi:CBS domain containing-hemolysin-like protein
MTQLEVRHIVVPRTEIELLSLERPIEENLHKVRESGHTRFPVCEVGLDTIVGFVHGKDLLAKALDHEQIDLRELAREPLFVPDTMAVPDFLSELQIRQSHCAAVVDERGTVIGFAFLEDALEEVVGPLGDEFDVAESEFVEVGDGVFEAPGYVPLPEIFDRLGFSLSDEEREDEDTLGGHVTARLGRLAKVGDTVQMGPFSVEVVEVSPRRTERLRLRRASPGESAGEEHGSSSAARAAGVDD